MAGNLSMADHAAGYHDEWFNDETSYEALRELLSYEFKNQDEVGQALERFNGAICVDIFRDATKKVVRSPINYLILLKQMTKENYTKPSYGLKCEGSYRKNKYIHFMYENGHGQSIGICYFDQKRPLSVKQVHECERSTKYSGIKKTVLVANKIGIPAKNEVSRINSEYDDPILNLEHFDSIKMRYLYKI
ncbi:MAG: hypothetical protein ACXAD7_20775 [Candidatus Kariarchaeaceae archaeon]|jgi:hypothetical protein